MFPQQEWESFTEKYHMMVQLVACTSLITGKENKRMFLLNIAEHLNPGDPLLLPF